MRTAVCKFQILMKHNCFASRRTGIPRPCDNVSRASTYPSNHLYHTISTTSRSPSDLFPSIDTTVGVTANGTPFNTRAWWIRRRGREETSEDGVRIYHGRRVGGLPTPPADEHARYAGAVSSGDVVHGRISGSRELGSDDCHSNVSGWTGATAVRWSIGWSCRGSATTALVSAAFSAWVGLPYNRSERELPVSCSTSEPTGPAYTFELHVLVINFPSTIANVAFISSSTLSSRNNSICAITGVLCQHAK